MKKEKELNSEIIRRLLDGDLDPDEKKELAGLIRSDPALQEEFEALAGTVRAVETSERMPAPPFFTAEVMRRLPRKKAVIGTRIRDFLLKARVFKWNMATALATAVFAALILTQVVRTRNMPLETAVDQRQEQQVVTVTMNLHAPEAHRVAIAGTFNKWNADANVLAKQENGVWTISIPLKPGEYSYMFIVDGKAWVADPNAEFYSDDGFGSKNAVVRVKT